MSVAVPLDTNHSTCYHCNGIYDGSKVSVGQEITCPHCARALFHTVQFGHFNLKRKLGAGGTCTVYLAHDQQTDQEVAVKILKESLSKDIEVAAHFLEEARVTATLQHQNIVRVYSSGEYSHRYYLSMEHLPGGSFDDRIVKQGRLTEVECLKIGFQAAQALQFAAVKGLLHRDVKPGNILFDGAGNVKVVDFGLFTKRGAPNPNTGEIWGTAYYVPPERLNAEPEDFRSDMYALAASLYHGLTGRAPIDASDLAKLAQNVGQKPNFTSRISAMLFAEKSRRQLEPTVIPVRRLNPRISVKTGQTIDKAMAKSPKNRFQSYVEFVQCLDDAKKSLPTMIQKGNVPPTPQPSQFIPPPVHTQGNSATPDYSHIQYHRTPRSTPEITETVDPSPAPEQTENPEA